MSAGVFFVEGTLLRVLQLSRLLGGAPLKIEIVAHAAFASLSYPWAVYSWIITTLLNILVCFLSYLSLIIYTDTQDPTDRSRLFISLSLLQTFLLTLRVFAGSYRSVKRMKSLTQQLNGILKVFNQFNKKSNSTEKCNVVLNILLMFLLFATVAVVSVGTMSNSTYLEGVKNFVIVNIMCYQKSMAVLLDIQVILVNFKISEALNLLKFQLREVVNNTGYKSTLDYYKVIRRVGKSYLTICNVVKQINNCEGVVIFLMFSSIVIFLVFAGYVFADCLNDSITSRLIFGIVTLAIPCYTCIHQILFFTRPCHQIDKEVDEIKVLVGELIYKETDVGAKIPVEFDVLFKQLNLSYPVYSVLGMFTVKRSTLTAILSAWVTYTIILWHQENEK